jgi:hypothetical protein
LQSAQTVSSREGEECRETKYKEYCQEALGAQGTYALNMSMMADTIGQFRVQFYHPANGRSIIFNFAE